MRFRFFSADKAKFTELQKKVSLRPFPMAPILALGIAAALSGCASIPKSVYTADPAAFLEGRAQVYAQLSGNSLREIAMVTKQKDMDNLIAALLRPTLTGQPQGPAPSNDAQGASKFDMDQILSFLSKASKVGIGLDGFSKGSTHGEAVVLGDFPVMPVRMALATSGDWASLKSGYMNRNAALFLRAPQPGILHFSTYSEPPDQATSPGDPIPKRFSDLKSKDILLWIDKPAELLARNLIPDGFEIPINGIACSAVRVDPAPAAAQGPSPNDPLYDFDIYVVMRDPAAAASFKPVIRFLWAGLVEKVFKENRTAMLEKPIDLNGDTYEINGIRLPISALSGALLNLSKPYQKSDNP